MASHTHIKALSETGALGMWAQTHLTVSPRLVYRSFHFGLFHLHSPLLAPSLQGRCYGPILQRRRPRHLRSDMRVSLGKLGSSPGS